MKYEYYNCYSTAYAYKEMKNKDMRSSDFLIGTAFHIALQCYTYNRKKNAYNERVYLSTY